jgi:hypothetical protein
MIEEEGGVERSSMSSKMAMKVRYLVEVIRGVMELDWIYLILSSRGGLLEIWMRGLFGEWMRVLGVVEGESRLSGL